MGEITIQIHYDGATDNQNRLGAVVDLQFVLNTIGLPSRVLVSAGDDISRFPNKPLWEKFLCSYHHHIVALPVTNRERLKKTGVLEMGEKDRVLRLHEKPELTPSRWICPPQYFFQPSLWSKIESFLQTSGNHDALGYFIDYLCQQEPVDAFRFVATRQDIGSIDSYHAAEGERDS
jgi:glucose-1-phosphate thymidylyltransferase